MPGCSGCWRSRCSPGCWAAGCGRRAADMRPQKATLAFVVNLWAMAAAGLIVAGDPARLDRLLLALVLFAAWVAVETLLLLRDGGAVAFVAAFGGDYPRHRQRPVVRGDRARDVRGWQAPPMVADRSLYGVLHRSDSADVSGQGLAVDRSQLPWRRCWPVSCLRRCAGGVRFRFPVAASLWWLSGSSQRSRSSCVSSSPATMPSRPSDSWCWQSPEWANRQVCAGTTTCRA